MYIFCNMRKIIKLHDASWLDHKNHILSLALFFIYIRKTERTNKKQNENRKKLLHRTVILNINFLKSVKINKKELQTVIYNHIAPYLTMIHRG